MIEQEPVLAAYSVSAFTGLTIIMAEKEQALLAPVTDFQKNILYISGFYLLFTTLATFMISRQLAEPIRKIQHSINHLDLADLNAEESELPKNSAYELTKLHMAYLQMARRLQLSLNETLSARSRETEARMLALQAQMNPHFLYNTITIISIKAEDNEDPDVVAMCESLTAMLRYIAQDSPRGVTLAGEIEHLKQYLFLMETRFPEKLNYSLTLEDGMEQLTIPKLTIQPLVENCFKHGFKQTLDLPVTVVATAEDGETACALLKQHRPEEELLPVLRQILDKKLLGRRSFTVCATSTCVDFHDIWQAAQKARVLLKNALIPCQSSVITGKSAATPSYHTFDEPLQNLVRYIKNGKMQAFTDNLSSFFHLLQDTPISQDGLEQILLFLLSALEDSIGPELFDRESVSTAIRQIIFLENNDTAMYEQIQRRLESEAATQAAVDSSTADVALAIKRYMDEKFYEPISLDALADTYHFSVSYISRIFRRQYGTAPLKYLLQVRMEEAKRLIAQNPDWNIGMIAQLVGYPDQHYFSRIFKSATGFSPSEYKEQQES